MNSKTFSALVQILTLVAVGIGAALVVYELRQTQDLARVQLYSDGFGLALQNINTMIGEDSAPIITKACLEPEKLTTAEKGVLNFYYFRQIQTIGRIRAISQISDVYPEGTWRNTPALDPIFRTAIGRAWWHSSIPDSDEVLKEYGNELMKRFENGPCESALDEWDASFQKLIQEGQPR